MKNVGGGGGGGGGGHNWHVLVHPYRKLDPLRLILMQSEGQKSHFTKTDVQINTTFEWLTCAIAYFTVLRCENDAKGGGGGGGGGGGE